MRSACAKTVHGALGVCTRATQCLPHRRVSTYLNPVCAPREEDARLAGKLAADQLGAG